MLDEPFDIPIQDGELYYRPLFIPQDEADRLYDYFVKNINWKGGTIQIFGKIHDIPRKQAYFADQGLDYGYSGKRLNTQDWDEEVLKLKEQLNTSFNIELNACLLNLYRDGKDSNGWHADDEAELGKNPVIASISLGEERDFLIKHKETGDSKKLLLEHGSLLIMGGAMQHHWKHALPKRKKVVNPRVNLTFRRVYEVSY